MRYLLAFPRRGCWRKLLIAVFCCVALFAGTGSIAFGSSIQGTAGGPSFTLQPVVNGPSTPAQISYFAIDTPQGTSIQEHVRVLNVGAAAGTAELSPVEATTAPTGGVAYLPSNQTQHDVGAWITLETQQLDLNPGQSQVVQFQVSVPHNARPGLHLGGIAVQAITQQQSTATTGKNRILINVQQRFVVPVKLNLPGPQSEGLVATSIQSSAGPGYQSLLVGLSNTGTDSLKPHGTLQVADTQGQPLRNFTMNLDTFLPQTSIDYPVYVTGQAFSAGTYPAALTLYYGHSHVLHYTTTFTITEPQLKQTFPNKVLQPPPPYAGLPPWAIILIAVLAVLVISGASGLFAWRTGTRAAGGMRRWK
ncbi:MAG: WxL protein peptidoglycan domain-containing protein [Ktedonobacteraceae bacterium]